jgi:DNA-binding response OmpR family regulator
VRSRPNGKDVAFVFFSSDTDSTKVDEALDAGAQDYLFKPLASQVVAAKVRHMLEQRHKQRAVRGVSGSLEEMSLPDIVQVLHQGRKTGALKLSGEGQSGTIYFKDGAIVDAAFGDLSGADAFYGIVGVKKGDFTIDPTVVPGEKTINTSPEMLLLEGLRRLDEAGR